MGEIVRGFISAFCENPVRYAVMFAGFMAALAFIAFVIWHFLDFLGRLFRS